MGSAHTNLAEEAAAALVRMHRELVERHPDGAPALRDLSISLNNVAGIQQARGQLDDALDARHEARDVYRVLAERYPALADPEELATLEEALGAMAQPSSTQIKHSAQEPS